MRIAVAGKGGAGKTTIAATLARLLARTGRDVVAIDGDSNPNLAAALGIAATARHAALPPRVVSRRSSGPALTVSVDELLGAHAVVGPDGVRTVLMGGPAHADEGCLCSAHATVAALLEDLGGRPDAVVVVDMEASPEHLSRGTTRSVDALLLVTEPYYRSLETVTRLAALARELRIARLAVVANKVRGRADAEAVAEFCARHDLDLIAVVPRRDAVVDADVAGISLLDYAESATQHDMDDVIAALASLGSALTAR
ncbi:MAG: AAA family ATPase [Actinomycetota bacterium]|nr:AAA family ATPase [Actinomycetota bacterium]